MNMGNELRGDGARWSTGTVPGFNFLCFVLFILFWKPEIRIATNVCRQRGACDGNQTRQKRNTFNCSVVQIYSFADTILGDSPRLQALLLGILAKVLQVAGVDQCDY